MNVGYCTRCKKKVPVSHEQRDGKEYLVKDCPDCGKTYDLISGDASMYKRKREMMSDESFPGCDLECGTCAKHRSPNIAFVETTNRCNMNCPICITNVPSMGFEFEPKMEYFDRIFKYYAGFEFPPSIQLFGGEPTVREDIFEIIELAKSYGLSVRLVTNGLKFADKDFCDRMMKAGVSVLISFDGLNPDVYEKLRGGKHYLDTKLKALENISRHKRGKVILMTVIDKNMNASDMEKFLDYCAENYKIVRGIFPMPLTQVWSEDRLDYKPERTTPEDVEKIVDNAVPGEVEFVPLGCLDFKNLARMFSLRPLPFVGVHPNCESFTLLVNRNGKYLALSNFLKKDLFSLVSDIRGLNTQISSHVRDGKKAGSMVRMTTAFKFAGIVLKYADFGALVDSKGVTALTKWLKICLAVVTGKNIKDAFKQHTGITSILQILILPFEDDHTHESERLEKCSSGHTYIAPDGETIKVVPTCLWEKYRDERLRDNATMFNKENFTKGIPSEGSISREK